jgi:hypothetical protein
MTTRTALADLASHHIEGYARAAYEAGKPAHFNVPLVSHIVGNLYVGGCIHGGRLDDDFRHVVSLYKWERYNLGSSTTRVEVEMYDAGEMPEIDQLHELADQVNTFLADGKTLVHCQAGLNRSNLVAALALIKQGRAPADAIALLRSRRSPVVLCNETFEAWLLSLASHRDSRSS